MAAGDEPGDDLRELRERLAAAQRRNAELTAALAEARAARNTLAEKLEDERYLRVRQEVVQAGLGRYLLVPPAEGTRPFLPGYARNPDFVTSRQTFVADLRERSWVTAADRVLDLGCGIGAIAALLVDVLGGSGTYVGVDVAEEAIANCRRNIASQHGNFSFEAIDVSSGMYRPTGAVQPGEFRFPFSDAAFDLAILALRISAGCDGGE